MTKADFLDILRRRLVGLPQAEIDEIIADYRAHFADGAAAGRSEEEIARALGDPLRLAREITGRSRLSALGTEPDAGELRRSRVRFLLRSLPWISVFLLPFLVLVSLAFFTLIAGIVAMALCLAGLAVFKRRIYRSAFAYSKDDEDAEIDANATEGHWAWDGGDTVDIAVPGTVHYRGGSGDEVIARGSREAIAHIRVRNGKITQSWSGRWARRDLDITLPGRTFRTIEISGSNRLIMQDVNQPSLDLSISGSGSVRAQGASERVKLSIAGSGKAKLAELTMKRLDIDISGSGKAEAAPQDEVNIDIAGSGDVRLLSDPERMHTDIAGSGRVIRAPGQISDRNK